MEDKYNLKKEKFVNDINDTLQNFCSTLLLKNSKVSEAVEYSLLSQGKRVRGCLVLAFAELAGGNYNIALKFAAAVEMVHAYSLIHDDLPCMDDDDLRRGQPSCHIKFGEAVALLAGDALLTMAFEVLSSTNFSEEHCLKAILKLSGSIGPRGMILGQEFDLAFEGKQANITELLTIHKNKTGALISASMELGYYSAKEEAPKQAHMFIDKLGLVFQMVDDALDVSQTSQQLGKPAKSDISNKKSTFITLYGIDETARQVNLLADEMLSILQQLYNGKAVFLELFTQELTMRTK